MPPSLPEVIGKYTIERFIESGGMGDVYLARDPALDRQVAIKFLREGFDNQEMRERFEREARAAGRLSHPNIVTIYEFGVFEGRPFIAMEFVRGEPLSKLIRRREPIPLVRKLEMMEGLCSGLAHAHKTGMVHRDIKPANLMVDNDGGPLKILDFGIVRMAGSGLTSHGVLVGTINYMSPEQITGRGTIDLRSDVFAVGAVLHEIFTYQRAFPGEMTDVLYKIVHAQPESAAVLAPGLDPGIVRAIDQCLEKSADRRYQDLSVLRRDLARIRQRLEIEEQDGYGHTALTVRHPTDPASRGGRPSGSHRTPVSGTPGAGTPQPGPRTPSPSGAGTPHPSTPPSAPSAPSAPQTPGSDRARRAAEAAADLARAQRAAEEARLELEREAEEQARADAERAEQERQARERAERERLARERAQAEQARLAREHAERVKTEQARSEQARLEQARQEQARQEQQRLERARAEEAERARVERERLEQVRLEEARQAREQAERERAEAQKKAAAEARRQAEARREQRAREVAHAQQDVAAGRFVEAVQRLRPWTAESAGDGAFATLLRDAEAGAARLDAERREQEALARRIESAKELIVRQDFAGASTIVQAILQGHPTDPAAKSLEKEIARGLEFRAKAAAAVERARALFDARPGDAMELLERFQPAHGLVDSALADLRERHAARERERVRREQQARRQARIDAVTAQAGAVVRNRGVQAAAGALLVLIVVIASWSSIFPPAAIDPGPGVNRGDGAAAVPATPGAATSPAGGDDQAGEDEAAVAPSGNGGGQIQPPAESGQKPTAPIDPRPSAAPGGGRTTGPLTPDPPSGPTPAPNAGPRSSQPSGNANATPRGDQPSVSDRQGGGVAIVPPTSNGNAPTTTAIPPTATPTPTPAPTPTTKPPVPTPGNGRAEPRPEAPPEPARDTAKVDVPPPRVDNVEIAKKEIRQWMNEYAAAYKALDAVRVRAMNPATIFRPALYKSAAVSFFNAEIVPAENGQRAVLHVDVQYEYEFKRGSPPAPLRSRVAWTMRKTPAGWVANAN